MQTGQPILVELIDVVNSVIIFLPQITLLKGLPFLLESLTVTLTVLLFWIFFFFLLPIISSMMAFPPLRNSNHAVVSVSIDFPINSKQDAPFHHIPYNYSWEDICKLSASAANTQFCEWFRFELRNISITVCTRSILTHLHGFQLLVLLP